MPRLLIALLLFLHTPAVRADTPPAAIGFAIDMSDSTHENSIDGLTPAELQLSALQAAFETIANQNDLSCALPFQLQIIYSSRPSLVVADWTIVPGTATGYRAAAAIVERLSSMNLFFDGHKVIVSDLEQQLLRSGSKFRFGVITANGSVKPSVKTSLAAQVRDPTVRFYGASLDDVMTVIYLESITQDVKLVQSQQELHDWFVWLLRTTVAPNVCLLN